MKMGSKYFDRIKIAIKKHKFHLGKVVILFLFYRLPKDRRNKLISLISNLFTILKIKMIKAKLNYAKTIYIDPRDPWALREYKVNSFYDHEEISSIKKYIPGHYLFVDVGANYGAYTFILGDHFKNVLSIEPDQRCFNCLLKTKRDLNAKNVNLFNYALSDRDEDGYLFPCKGHSGDSRIYNPGEKNRMGGEPIKIITFDHIIKFVQINADLVFIKLDAQGVEPNIIKGMDDLLRSAKDIILFSEIQGGILEAAGNSVEGFFELLRNLGFKPVELFNGLDEVDWKKVYDTLQTKRDFCFRKRME